MIPEAVAESWEFLRQRAEELGVGGEGHGIRCPFGSTVVLVQQQAIALTVNDPERVETVAEPVTSPCIGASCPAWMLRPGLYGGAAQDLGKDFCRILQTPGK